MKVFIEKENKHLELEAKTGTELLDILHINPSEIILVRNNEVILIEDILSKTDEILVLSVISGG